MRRLKFDRVRAAAVAAADLMARSLGDWIAGADLLVPMPLSEARRRSRGFNQSDLLAKRLARRLDMDLSRPLVRRHRPSQVGLTRPERRENVRGAYRCRRGLAAGDSICLVDDVMTTGSSIADATRALAEAGADDVIGVTLTYRSPRSL